MKSVDELLTGTFRLAQFRPRQREVIEDLLAGHDVVCVMPTGAGKSLCYQLPAVALGGLTIVVSPLIALMADQIRQLGELGVPSLLLNSSQDSAKQRETLRELQSGFAGILYVAPERFAAPSFRALLPQLRPRLFVVDEAHCVSFWGHDFRPDYMRLAEIREALGSPVTAALTATATPQVRSDIVSFLQLRSPKMHVTGFDRPNLRYAARYFRTDGDKDSALLRGLEASPGTGIVYCATRKTVEELTAYLSTGITRPHHLRLPCRHVSTRRAKSARNASCKTKVRSSSPPTPSAWASTNPTSALCCITTCRAAWKPITRKRAAPGAMAAPPTACCITRPATTPFKSFSSIRLARTTSSSKLRTSSGCKPAPPANSTP